MGNRISKVFTKTGDDGTTGLGDGSRVPKYSLRIEAIGDVHETNTTLGLVRASLPMKHDRCAKTLERIQNVLFDLGGELSIPGYTIIEEDDVRQLEEEITVLNEHLEPLKNFILPAGSEVVSRLHHASAVCRRAERSTARLKNSLQAHKDELGRLRAEQLNEHTLHYLNRLSDYLFTLARYYAKYDGGDVLWSPKPKPE